MFHKIKLQGAVRLFALASMAIVLTACGGGSSGGSDCTRIDASRSSALPGCTTASTGTTDGSASTAATVQFLVSSQQLNSAGTMPVELTAIARDANGQALSGRAVQFKVEDPENSAYVSNFSQTSGTTHSTGANGQLTATLNAGGSKANRTIKLTASVDGASASNVVNVVGTKLTISGSNALVFGASTQINLVLTDSAGKPIPSVPLTVTSSAGNTVALVSPATDASGKALVNVMGSKAGADTLTASGGGANASYAITVSGNGFAFIGPAAGTVSAIGSPVTISVRWTNNGQPVAGETVNFATTRGILSPSQATTNANGDASTTLNSTAPGPATITASGPANSGVAGSVNVSFVSVKPAASVDLQADKTTVSINPPGISTNASTLTAVVRDVDNNRIAGAIVNFHIDQDPTQGTLTVATATTDENGIAKSQYVPTSQSSPTNGVVISAAVAGSSINSRPLLLTVANQNLFVRIGTDNAVQTPAGSPNYAKLYSAFVTDAAGNPVPNATVQFLLRPRQDEVFDPVLGASGFQQRTTGDFAYYKGFYKWNGVFWVPTSGAGFDAPVGCYNEDVNFNGIINDLEEDFNGNNTLDPGNPYSVNADTSTNAAGYALATITYPKDRANWTGVTLQATAQVSGTEATAIATFILPVSSDDVNEPDVYPPGFNSPYGTSLTCANPR